MTQPNITPPDNSIEYYSHAILVKTREGVNKKNMWSERKLRPPESIAYEDIDDHLMKKYVFNFSCNTFIPGIGSHECESSLSWRASEEDIIKYFNQNILNNLHHEIKDSFRNRLIDLTVDVLDLCLFFLLKNRNVNKSVKVSADDFLNFRGIKKRIDKEKSLSTYATNARRLIGQHLNFLTKLHLNVNNIPIKDASGEIYYISAGGPLINVGYFKRTNFETCSDGTQTAFEKFMWTISAGAALQELKYYMNYTFIDKSIFALDHNKDKYPKRIGRYLSALIRIRTKKIKKDRPIKVGTILEHIGVPLDHPRPHLLKDKFEKWLDKLVKINVIKEHTYSPDIPDVSKKGWYHLWLNTNLEFKVSNTLSQYRDDLSNSLSNKRSKNPSRVTSEDHLKKLNSLKNELKMTNHEICLHLGISKSHLSMIFSGKRNISKKLSTKIEHYFAKISHQRLNDVNSL